MYTSPTHCISRLRIIDSALAASSSVAQYSVELSDNPCYFINFAEVALSYEHTDNIETLNYTHREDDYHDDHIVAYDKHDHDLSGIPDRQRVSPQSFMVNVPSPDSYPAPAVHVMHRDVAPSLPSQTLVRYV